MQKGPVTAQRLGSKGRKGEGVTSRQEWLEAGIMEILGQRLFFFNWDTVALQYCVCFCCTST